MSHCHETEQARANTCSIRSVGTYTGLANTWEQVQTQQLWDGIIGRQWLFFTSDLALMGCLFLQVSHGSATLVLTTMGRGCADGGSNSRTGRGI